MFSRSYRTPALVLVTLSLLSTGCPDLGPMPEEPEEMPPGEEMPTPGPPAPVSGVPGQAGFGPETALPGLMITIRSVTRGGMDEAPRIGEPIAVTFTLRTRAGRPIDVNELSRFSAYVSGPIDHVQRVIPPEGDLAARITRNPDGSFTYTFSAPLPAAFAPPFNDSTAFGPENGERTGDPLPSGTYAVGIEARRDVPLDGQSHGDAGDALLLFVLGDGPSLSREIVTEAACEKCHNQVTVHGENRFTVAQCILCHTDGAEDRTSGDPAKATPGASIQFANMIHRIHRGAELPNVQATAQSGDPFRYQLVGFGESVQDFSHVRFPVMPGGTGFNEQTRNCGACHDGAAQGERAYTNPGRQACTGCHDDLDFVNGTLLDFTKPEVAGGMLSQSQLGDPAFRTLVAGAIRHTFSDDQCTLCHAPDTALDSRAVHRPPLSDPALIAGLRVAILDGGGATGPGFFQVGDVLTVTFQIVDAGGTPIDLAQVASVNLVLSGPTGNYQRVLPASGSVVAVRGAGGVPTSGTGPFTFTNSSPIPDSYPPPFNDSAAFDFADGSGELSGQPLMPGTYTIGMWAFRQFTTLDGVTYRETSPTATRNITIGTAAALEPYPGYVTDAKCNTCHGDLRFHGNGRKGVEGCVLCHTAGTEDRANPVSGQTQDPAPDTIDFKVMIHKVHYARHLNLVQRGGRYDLIGFAPPPVPADTGNVVDFSNADLPAMPNGAAHCTTCHATDAWKAPAERSDVLVWRIACGSCHDSSAATVHMALNTLPGDGLTTPGAEACATCHGEQRFVSVESEHRFP